MTRSGRPAKGWLAGLGWACCAWAAAPAALAQGQGLSAAADFPSGTRWQARLERQLLPAAALAARAGTPLWLLGQPAQSLRLLGDYQFSALRLGSTGGLRLTGGVLINLHQPGVSRAVEPATALWSGSGYAGVGYASGSVSGDWGFSADFGLTALPFGGLGANAAAMAQGLRDARPQPLLRLGVNLAF